MSEIGIEQGNDRCNDTITYCDLWTSNDIDLGNTNTINNANLPVEMPHHQFIQSQGNMTEELSVNVESYSQPIHTLSIAPDEGEEEVNSDIEFSCIYCKSTFNDPNDLIKHLHDVKTCSIRGSPKILLSDHLLAVSLNTDASCCEAMPYLNNLQIPKVFQHQLLSTFLNHKQSKEVNTDVDTICNAVESCKEMNNSPFVTTSHEFSHENNSQIERPKKQPRMNSRAVYKVKCSFHGCLSSSGTYSRLLHDVLNDLLQSFISNSDFENIQDRLTVFNESYDLIPQMVLCLNHVQYLSQAFKRSNAQWQKYIENEDNTGLIRFLKGFGGKDFSYSNFDELYDEMDEFNKKAAQDSILSYIDRC